MRKWKSMISVAICIAMAFQSFSGVTPVFAAEEEGVVISEIFTDSSFASYVSESFDTDEDGYLSDDEIAEVTSINVTDVSPAITDLTGIEYFTNLTVLVCQGQSIKSLDLSALEKLVTVNVSNNQMTTLLLPTSGDDLTTLNISGNYTTNLSASSLSGYDNLTYLNIANTSLSGIDVTDMKNLITLDVSGTAITSLDLSNNEKLTYLYCESMTKMSALDVATTDEVDHTSLVALYCSYEATGTGSLTSLDVSGDTGLIYLYCANNSISSLNMEYAPNIEYLDVSDNNIQYIYVSKTDESEDDALNLKSNLKELNIANNPIQNMEGTSVKTIDISGNTKLETLLAGGMSFDAIDISNNTSLSILDLSDNNLTSIDLSNNANLTELLLNDNNLECIDLSNQTSLLTLNVSNNQLVCLDLSNCTALQGDGATITCTGNSRSITLNTPDYDYDLSEFSTKYGFVKSSDTERTDDTMGDARMVADNVTGGEIDGYHLVPELNSSKMTYRYYYGIGKKYATFTLNIENPLTLKVWYTYDGSTSSSSSGGTVSLKVGDSITLYATESAATSYDGYSLEEITWSSSDTNVATVDADTGELTCVGAGTANIYVFINNRAIGYIVFSCHAPVTSIEMYDSTNDITYVDGDSIDMECGTYVSSSLSSKTLTAKCYVDGTLADSSISGVTYEVTDSKESGGTVTSSVITCSSKGVITAKGQGTAYLHITSTDSGVEMVIEVNVTQRVNSIKLSGTGISNSTKTMFIGDTGTVTATISPTTAANQEVSWESSDDTVVSVDNEGNIEALSSGTATITCSADENPDSVYATLVVKVYPDPSSVTLDTYDAELILGASSSDKTITLTATIDTGDEDISESTYTKTWTSSDTSVATVDSNGKVTAVSAGTAVIRCTVTESVYVECTITVSQRITSLSITADSTKLYINNPVTVTAAISPETASNTELTWSSSDETIAVVSSDGVITPKATGSVTIKCEATDGSGKSASKTFTVYRYAESISLSASSVTVYMNKTQKVEVTVLPSDTSTKTVTWESANTSIAKVSNGTITGVAPGTTTVTCTASDGSGVKSTVTVTVLAQVTSITVAADKASINVGDKLTLKTSILPSNANNKKLTWSSSNESIATVDQNGVVTAKAKGTVKITAEAADGMGAKNSYQLTINQLVTSVALDNTSISLVAGNSQSLQTTILPSNANDRSVTWKSSNTKVATVTNGRVTAVAPGTATITCTTADGTNLSASCTVTVQQLATSVKLNTEKKTIVKGKTYTLKATVEPTSTSDKTVTWTSSNESVATVSSSGVVKAVGAGTATITCTAADGSGVKATCTITTKIKVKKIKLNKKKVTMKKGETFTLTATIKPTDATNKNVKWTSSNKKVATVDKNGVVTAKKKGKVTIKCKAKDGSKKVVKCKIIIK